MNQQEVFSDSAIEDIRFRQRTGPDVVSFFTKFYEIHPHFVSLSGLIVKNTQTDEGRRYPFARMGGRVPTHWITKHDVMGSNRWREKKQKNTTRNV